MNVCFKYEVKIEDNRICFSLNRFLLLLNQDLHNKRLNLPFLYTKKNEITF